MPQWEVEEILAHEYFRNICITLVSVMVIVFIMLGDWQTSIFIFCAIIFTLVDVMGFIYAMGMTLDPFSTICFVCGIGLCVDYGVHIGHFFITTKGSKTERAINSFITISPAILHGGTSSILALVPLAFSESHTFITIFRAISSNVALGSFTGSFSCQSC